PFILNIGSPAHPCARAIPFILNIKTRPGGRVLQSNLIFNLSKY
ncbi:MAG: hypothetical protein ACI9AP_001094, partial [Flavobacteriales bacterium]